MTNVKVYEMKVKGHGQGHTLKILWYTSGKALSYGTHMPHMEALSHMIKKVMANVKVFQK